MSPKRSFSILNLLLLTTIIAMGVAIFVMRTQVFEAERRRAVAEARFQEIAAKFGYIESTTEFKTQFLRVPNNEGEVTYQAHFPKGSRYLLHISDVPMKHAKIPTDLTPTKTMSMNGWRDGADVILKWAIWLEDDTRRFEVTTKTERLFNYEIRDWNPPKGCPNDGFELSADTVKSFDPSEKIILSYFGNEKLERGVILWLEPFTMWDARQKKNKQND